VLGVAQDGGAPHAGCTKECCEEKWNNPTQHARVSSIGIVDPVTKESWIIDATPDFAVQLTALDNQLSGIFLTHAHIGHYTGLMHLGREVMGAKEIPVYAMPRMKTFLELNGPWNQLVALNNISINEINDNVKITLNERLSITPFLVPHRDEYSETVGYKVEGPNKSLVFIPDVDKWQKWDQDIKEVVSNNTYSLLDGTFYDIDELPGRDMSEIPHPFIVESMDLFNDVVNKSGIYFIHLNHSNPALNFNSNAFDNIKKSGFNIAERGQFFDL
jgi:pyrroloquinoline quinone biosynthesis protein B